jgi:hypothetical protein
MVQKRKTQCSHCDESCTILWEQDDLEPISCPFCGAALEKEDVNELEEEIIDEDTNWN